MDKAKKGRKVLRSSFTKAIAGLSEELPKDTPDKNTVLTSLALLENKFEELQLVNKQIFDLMISTEATDDECNKEMDSVDEYFKRLEIVKLEAKTFLRAPDPPPGGTPFPVPGTGTTGVTVDNTRKFEYPKIELKKFTGELIEWLPFWSMFKNIHEDPHLSPGEKFQYLSQTMVEGTRASDLVNSYPPTAENYSKVIDSLKNRFGREDLLVEVYMRELVKLMLNKSKGTLASMYDKLETQLRGLESLGVTTSMCAAMLYPLVESSLPEEVLRAWQRQNNGGKKPDD